MSMRKWFFLLKASLTKKVESFSVHHAANILYFSKHIVEGSKGSLSNITHKNMTLALWPSYKCCYIHWVAGPRPATVPTISPVLGWGQGAGGDNAAMTIIPHTTCPYCPYTGLCSILHHVFYKETEQPSWCIGNCIR